MFNGKTHYKWPFSIAMLNYQRVNPAQRNHRATFASVTSILRQNCAASARAPSWKRSFKLRFGGLGGFGGGFLDPGVPPYFTIFHRDLRWFKIFQINVDFFWSRSAGPRIAEFFLRESQTGPRKPLWAGSTFRGMVTLNPKVRFDHQQMEMSSIRNVAQKVWVPSKRSKTSSKSSQESTSRFAP